MSAFGTLLQFLSAMRLLTRGSSRHGKLFPMFLKLHNHTTDNDSVYVTRHLTADDLNRAFSGLITRIILQNYKLGSAAQRHRLLIEHRLDRLARCLYVEAVLLD